MIGHVADGRVLIRSPSGFEVDVPADQLAPAPAVVAVVTLPPVQSGRQLTFDLDGVGA